MSRSLLHVLPSATQDFVRGLMLARAQACLAHVAGSGFVPFLLVLSILALLPFAAIRAGYRNFLMGMVQTAVFGVSIIVIVPIWPAAKMWHEVSLLCCNRNSQLLGQAGTSGRFCWASLQQIVWKVTEGHDSPA